jgi:phosphoribosylanthranilate isomerase
MSLWVKLCGIRSIRELEWAIDAGADAVGLVLTPSVRQVEVDLARTITEAAAGRVATVGVFHYPERNLVERFRDEVGFDLCQAETASVRGIDGIVTLPVVHDSEVLGADVEDARQASGSGKILVESAGKGGHGNAPDSRRVVRLGPIDDVVLAGGLNAANVAEWIYTMQPGGVDVSSGVESSRGEKDRALMFEFVAAARSAQERQAHG